MRRILNRMFMIVVLISYQALFASASLAEDLIIGNGQVYLHDGSPECRKYGRIVIGTDGRWVIGGSSLCAEAQQLEVGSRSAIVAFSGTNEQWAAQGANGASPGQGGSPGGEALDGGSVRLQLGAIVLKDPKSPLMIDLAGQFGGTGGNGAQGAPGAEEPKGSASKTMCRHIKMPDGIDVNCHCQTVAGPGEIGIRGGNGGDGGPGGPGGDSGNLTIVLKRGDPKQFVLTNLTGGRGETGGKAGEGGPGGQGGPGGDGSGECEAGARGPVGPAGDPGVDRSAQRARSGSDGIFKTQ